MSKSRKNFPNFMLLSTAFSDMFVSGLTWIYYVISISSQAKQDFDEIFIDYSFALRLGTLLLSALDRMVSVIRPLKHRNVMMKPKIKCVILIVWALAFIPPAIRLGMSNFNLENFYQGNDMLYIYCYRSICILVILLIIVILIATCCKVSRVIRHPIAGSTVSILSMHKRNARVIKIFIGMIVAFAFCFVPIPTTMLLHGLHQLSRLGHIGRLSLIMAGDLLYLCSSVVNPIITLSLKEDYRLQITVFIQMLNCTEQYVERRQRQTVPVVKKTTSTSV